MPGAPVFHAPALLASSHLLLRWRSGSSAELLDMTPSTSLPTIVEDARTAVLDALPRVSFRDRRAALAASDSPAPGKYLELDDGDEALLFPLADGTTHLGRGFAADF